MDSSHTLVYILLKTQGYCFFYGDDIIIAWDDAREHCTSKYLLGGWLDCFIPCYLHPILAVGLALFGWGMKNCSDNNPITLLIIAPP